MEKKKRSALFLLERKRKVWKKNEMLGILRRVFIFVRMFICLRQLIKRFFLNWWAVAFFSTHTHSLTLYVCCFIFLFHISISKPVSLNACKQRSTIACLPGRWWTFLNGIVRFALSLFSFSLSHKSTIKKHIHWGYFSFCAQHEQSTATNCVNAIVKKVKSFLERKVFSLQQQERMFIKVRVHFIRGWAYLQ